MPQRDNISFYEWSKYSDKGLVRTNNEDAVITLPEDGCFAVADGMGGGDAGEVASRMVIDAVKNALYNTWNEFPGEPKYSLLQNLIRVNAEIASYRDAHHFQMMGSTLSAVLFDPWMPSRVHCCHVGDSRIYCFRDGEIFQISRDQTLGEELRKNSSVLKNIPERMFHILTQVIGGTAYLYPEWREITVFEEDLLVLCSDGVTAVREDRDLENVMRLCSEPARIVDAIKEQVLLNGAPDNFSVICIKLHSIPEAPAVEADDQKENDLLMSLSEKFCISKKT